MLHPGIAKAVVKRHWFTTSQSGIPGFAVKVEVSDDWDSGCEMIGTIWLSPKAMGMARSQLKALGFDCDAHDLSELEGAVSLVAHKVEVELKEETYKGRTELRITRFGGTAPRPTEEALAKATVALRAVKKYRQNTDEESPTVELTKTPLTGDPLTTEARTALDQAKNKEPAIAPTTSVQNVNAEPAATEEADGEIPF